MAEWSCSGLQIHLDWFDSSSGVQFENAPPLKLIDSRLLNWIKNMPDIIITANRLDDGSVEYYGGNDIWTSFINNAWVFPSKDNAKESVNMLSATGELERVGIYSIPVEKENGQITPVTKREEIRANGPTVNGHSKRDIDKV
jgi:hypothetical protein